MKKNLVITENITVIPPNDKLYTYEDMCNAYYLGHRHDLSGGIDKGDEFYDSYPIPQNGTSEPQG